MSMELQSHQGRAPTGRESLWVTAPSTPPATNQALSNALATGTGDSIGVTGNSFGPAPSKRRSRTPEDHPGLLLDSLIPLHL